MKTIEDNDEAPLVLCPECYRYAVKDGKCMACDYDEEMALKYQDGR